MIIGITGSIGAGKTRVSTLFSEQGYNVINVDKLYETLTQKHRPLLAKIVNVFGPIVLNKNRQLNRNELKKIVFSNSKKLKQLNALTHPFVKKELKKRINQLKNKSIVIDAPLLFEAGWEKLCDQTILVHTKQELQIKRALRRKKHTKQEIIHILKSQWPSTKKQTRATHLINNSKTWRHTASQVKTLIKKLHLTRI